MRRIGRVGELVEDNLRAESGQRLDEGVSVVPIAGHRHGAERNSNPIPVNFEAPELKSGLGPGWPASALARGSKA